MADDPVYLRRARHPAHQGPHERDRAPDGRGGPTCDTIIAEMLVRALAANGAAGAHHLIQGRAEVWVWRVHEGEQAPYVAAVEGPDLRAYIFLPDAQPATLEALVERLCPRDDRA